MSGTGQPEVALDNKSGMDIDLKAAASNAVMALGLLGFDSGELGVTFVSSEEMTRLNREYLRREGPTDVISFPIDAGEPVPGMEAGAGVPVLLGDVVICPRVALEQAGASASSLEDEICLLLVHGILHVAGYDHETDDGEMEERQAEVLGRIRAG